MTNKIWLKNYPAGMPAEIDADLFRVHPGPAREDLSPSSPTSRPITTSAAR